jgi:DNA adenine methylase
MQHQFGREPIGPPLDPFLRWAGGKRRLVPFLLKALPSDIGSLTYNEPFVGAGALFLALRPRKARLSDANAHLIDCYSYVCWKPDQIADYLSAHSAKTGKRYYYEVRDKYNRASASAAQAARFIYLNKTCFNGIFRVNVQGEFNVPYGHKNPPLLPSRKELRAASALLKGATLRISDFSTSLAALGKNDFVYLDPPYPPINGTSYFTHYTADRFGERDQEALADSVKALDARGAKFMMSNADTKLIRSLYARFRIIPLTVTRYITCKAIKHRADEVIITNYPISPSADD